MHVNESASNANLSPELPELSTLGTVRTRELRAGDQEDIVSGTQAYDADQVEAATGIRAPAMAELRVGKESLLILSLTGIERGEDGFRRLRVDGEEIQVDVDHIAVQTSLWNANQTQIVDGEPLRRGAVIVRRAQNVNNPRAGLNDQLGRSTRLLDLPDSPLRHFSVLSVGNKVRVRVNDGVARNVQIRDLVEARQKSPADSATADTPDTAFPASADPATTEHKVAISSEPEEATPQLTLEQIFQSDDTFQNALAPDSAIDSETRGMLSEIRDMWMRVQIAQQGNEVWDDHVTPRIQQLRELLPELEGATKDLSDKLGDIQTILMALASALDDNTNNTNRSEVESIISAQSFPDGKESTNVYGALEIAVARANSLDNYGADSTATRLKWSAVETDERYVEVMRAHLFSERHLGEFVEACQVMVDPEADPKANLADIRQHIGAKYDEAAELHWKTRYELLTELAGMAARSSDRLTEMSAYEALNKLEEVIGIVYKELPTLSGSRADELSLELEKDARFIANTLIGEVLLRIQEFTVFSRVIDSTIDSVTAAGKESSD